MPHYRAVLSVQGMTCASCANSVQQAAEQCRDVEQVSVQVVDGRAVALVPDRQTAVHLAEAISDVGFDAELVELLPVAADPLVRLETHIEGMTCAACANAVRRAVAGFKFVKTAQIDALSGNAVFAICAAQEQQNEQAVREAVEDCGYEFTVVRRTPEKNLQADTKSRTITLEICGMFCEKCPSSVLEVLASFGDAVEVEAEPTLQKPLVQFTYVPGPPAFGIRAIITEISAKVPELSLEVVHPKSPEEVAQENRERERKTVLLRLQVTAALAVPAFVLMFFPMAMMSRWGRIAMLVLATPVYFWSAAIFHKHAFNRGSFNGPLHFGSMNLLMSLGTSISYWASLWLLVMDPHADSYFDSVIFLTLFLLVGRYLDIYSKAKTAMAVSTLTALRPDTAVLEGEGQVPLWAVDVGDTVRVSPGAKVPVDGIVSSGSSELNEATLTGEAKPVAKRRGDHVYSGTINVGNEVLVVEATAVENGTLLDGIMDAVRQGQMVRAQVEQFSDAVTAMFVPIIIYIALLVWLAWYISGTMGFVSPHELAKCHCGWFVFSMEFAVAVFVVACPCGVGLAAPTALYVGGGVAAAHGVIARGGGEAFEQGAQAHVVCFDKTGTITTGSPVVTDVYFAERLVDDGTDPRELVQLAARMEDESNHPLALAVKEYALGEALRSRVEDVVFEPGQGLRARITEGPLKGHTAFLGNEALAKTQSVVLNAEQAAQVSTWKREGKSIVLLCANHELQMIMAIRDEIRPEARSTIEHLHRLGIACWMISGDNRETAEAIAAQVGITNVIAEVLPQQKADRIKWLQQTGRADSSDDARAVVAMVGDGVNDAPAIAVSDVGIAVGSGADVTLSTAKFILVHSDLTGVALTLDLSKEVMRKVKLNFAWAFIYNVLAVPFAAGILYPWTGYRLDPVFASLAMCLSSLSVMANSLLLKNYEFKST